MIRFEGETVLEQFEDRFGIKRGDMTPEQIEWLIKFAKHVRGRCRSNAALRNYLVKSFPNMKFTEVPVELKDGTVYQALRVAHREVNRPVVVDDRDE